MSNTNPLKFSPGSFAKLSIIKNLIELGNLENVYVSFEYQVPYTQKRIDCLIFGKNKKIIVIQFQQVNFEIFYHVYLSLSYVLVNIQRLNIPLKLLQFYLQLQCDLVS